MKFLSVRDLRGKAAQIWQELPQEKEIIVTNNGRPIAILSAINESNLEESLKAFRRARVADSVAVLQGRSVEQGIDNVSLAEINAEINVVRRKRKK